MRPGPRFVCHRMPQARVCDRGTLFMADGHLEPSPAGFAGKSARIVSFHSPVVLLPLLLRHHKLGPRTLGERWARLALRRTTGPSRHGNASIGVVDSRCVRRRRLSTTSENCDRIGALQWGRGPSESGVRSTGGVSMHDIVPVKTLL